MPVRSRTRGYVRPVAGGLLLGLGASVAQDVLAGSGAARLSLPTVLAIGGAVAALGLVEARARGVWFDTPGEPGTVDLQVTAGGATAEVGSHCSPTGEYYEDGVYRVVGADDEVVTLLRVADGAGYRRHTGELVRVGADVLPIVFEPARDPDDRLAPLWTLRNWLQGLYWSLRWRL